MNRAWTYIISRDLNTLELDQLLRQGQQFVKSWTAHEVQLHGSFEIFKKKIIIVKVNESIHEASGCSIDKLSKFIKNIEVEFNIELLNRLLVAIKNGEGIDIVHSSKIKELLQNGKLNQDSIIYNTAIANQEELISWEQSLKKTWLNKYLISA